MPVNRGPVYDANRIALTAAGAGFTGKSLETATAVALAESSGRVWVVNSIGCCVGLWQINVKAHPQYSRAEMQDPAKNARAAFAISSGGTNWRPWEAYTNGAYLLYLPAAKKAARGVASGTAGGPVPGGGDNPLLPDFIEGPADAAAATAQGLQDLAGFPARVVGWISDRNNIVRGAKVLVGLGLVLVGLYVVARPVTKGVQDAAGKVVGLAASKGRRAG